MDCGQPLPGAGAIPGAASLPTAEAGTGSKPQIGRRGIPGWVWIILGILIPAGLVGLLFWGNVLYIPQLASSPVTSPAPTFEGARLLVTVRGADGSPISGAQVEVQFGNIERRAQTNELGEARFPDLPQNTYTLNVSHAQYESWAGTVTMNQGRVNTSIQMQQDGSVTQANVPEEEQVTEEPQPTSQESPAAAPETHCAAGEVVYKEDFDDGVADNWREGRGLDAGWEIEADRSGGAVLHAGSSPSNPSQVVFLPNIFTLHFAAKIVQGGFHLGISEQFLPSELFFAPVDGEWHMYTVEISFNGQEFDIFLDGERTTGGSLETGGFKKRVFLEGGPGIEVYFDNFVGCEE